MNATERKILAALVQSYVGQASALFSEFTLDFVKLNMVNMKILSIAELQMVLDERTKLSSSRLTATRQPFIGSLGGESTLMIDEQSVCNLSQYLDHDTPPETHELDIFDTLSEVNNLMASGCIQYITQELGFKVEFFRPVVEFLSHTRLDLNRKHLSENSRVLLINTELDFKEDLIWGTWYLWIESASYTRLRRAISQYGLEN